VGVLLRDELYQYYTPCLPAWNDTTWHVSTKSFHNVVCVSARRIDTTQYGDTTMISNPNYMTRCGLLKMQGVMNK
jgi:hypothetical protein